MRLFKFKQKQGNKPPQAKVALLRKMNQSVQVNVPDDNYRINQKTGAVERIDKKQHATKKQRLAARALIREKMEEYDRKAAGKAKTITVQKTQEVGTSELLTR
jgi:hypothetical protein